VVVCFVKCLVDLSEQPNPPGCDDLENESTLSEGAILVTMIDGETDVTGSTHETLSWMINYPHIGTCFHLDALFPASTPSFRPLSCSHALSGLIKLPASAVTCRPELLLSCVY
jgi:hypothetical protein